MEYIGLLSGKKINFISQDIVIEGNSGEIFAPVEKNNDISNKDLLENITNKIYNAKTINKENRNVVEVSNITYEEMSIEELQQVVLNKMAKNGSVTDDMKKTVYENIYKNSLINWIKSFR